MPVLTADAATSDLRAHSVLIVDESEENREVLRTVLARRGLEIYEAAEGRAGLSLARAHHPDVIVLDLDADALDESPVRAGFAAESGDRQSSLVVLGRARRYPELNAPAGEVAKPYHYAALVNKIEQLVQVHRGFETSRSESS